jgi:hypothetical protein
MAKKKRVLLLIGEGGLGAKRKKLPIFRPHDYRSLINEAKKAGSGGVEREFIHVLRRRNEMQMNNLLQSLGIDRFDSKTWEKGFYHLAYFHHGVGHVAWYPARTNRNPATWSLEHDHALLKNVITLTNQGLSERAAVNGLAADPQKRRLFPYRRQELRHFPKGTDQKRREDALWSRLHKLKRSIAGRTLRLILDDQEESIGVFERWLRYFDMADALPVAGEKPVATK